MGKKKGGKAAPKKGAEVKKEDAFVPRLYPGERDNWMVIEFKLINWKFMNFKMKLREETRMFTIKDIIRQRHGKIEGIQLSPEHQNTPPSAASHLFTNTTLMRMMSGFEDLLQKFHLN